MAYFKVVLALVFVQSFALAANHNLLLQFTMKTVAKDFTVASYPSSVEDPLEITDERLVSAINRCQTAAHLLQSCDERKETDLAPTILKPLSPEEKKTKLSLYSKLLQDAIKAFQLGETQLLAEFAKPLESRDFSTAKKTFDDIDAQMKAAHAVFQETE